MTHFKASELPPIEQGRTLNGGSPWNPIKRQKPPPISDDPNDLKEQIDKLKTLRAEVNRAKESRQSLLEAADHEIETAEKAVQAQTALVVTLINELDPNIKARIE